jgi:hypothetical protein
VCFSFLINQIDKYFQMIETSVGLPAESIVLSRRSEHPRSGGDDAVQRHSFGVRGAGRQSHIFTLSVWHSVGTDSDVFLWRLPALP